MSVARAAAPLLVERHFLAMGTSVLVTVAVRDESRRAPAQQAIDEVQKLLLEFGREGWAWGSGALAMFNRMLAQGRAAPVPPLLQALFGRAWDIRRASGGLFEPRIGALVRLWGFDEASRAPRAPPAPDVVAALLAQLAAAPAYDGGAWYGPAPGVAWDFGAIGKGYIVDLALDWLQHRGFPDAIVNAGGNVAVRGGRGDRPWHVGIRDPRRAAELSVLLASLDVRDESVITHGDDQRFFEHQGRRYAHILHPHGGEPVRGLRSLTVVHSDGALADGGGAALFIAGREGWQELAKKLGIRQVLAVDDDGVAWSSAPLASRLQPAADARIEITA